MTLDQADRVGFQPRPKTDVGCDPRREFTAVLPAAPRIRPPLLPEFGHDHWRGVGSRSVAAARRTGLPVLPGRFRKHSDRAGASLHCDRDAPPFSESPPNVRSHRRWAFPPCGGAGPVLSSALGRRGWLEFRLVFSALSSTSFNRSSYRSRMLNSPKKNPYFLSAINHPVRQRIRLLRVSRPCGGFPTGPRLRAGRRWP